MTGQVAVNTGARPERRNRELLDGWALALVLPLLLALALFGAVHKAVWAGLVIFAGLGLLALSVRQLRAGQVDVHPRRVMWILVPALAALALGALQLWPNPPGDLAHPLWASAAAVLEAPVTARVSLTPADTLDVLLRLSSYLAVFWIALQLGRTQSFAAAGLRLVIAGVTVFAIYGLVVQLAGFAMVLWKLKTAYIGDLTGTLINRNSAATVIGLGWLTATAVLLGQLRNRLRGAVSSKEQSREAAEYLLNQGLWLAGSWIVLLVALFLTHSRGGMLSSLVGAAAIAFVLLRGQTFGRKTQISLSLSFLLGLLIVITISDGVTFDRLHNIDVSQEQRFQVYKTVVASIKDAPVTGIGLGSFRELFQLYQPQSIPGNWGKAHSSYLENGLEGGLFFAVLLFLSPLVVVVICIRGGRARRRDRQYAALGIGVGAQVGLHSLVDFSLQTPAITVFTAFLLGIAVAQAWSTQANLSCSPDI